MKLSELTNILQFDTDFVDNKIDVSFYTEIADILPKYAKNIDVLAISPNYITCDFYNFIFNHKDEIIKYIKTVYPEKYINSKIAGIFEYQDAEDIAFFIEYDMDAFLRGDY